MRTGWTQADPDKMDERLNVTFILPVLNETSSLRKTVDTIFEVAEKDLHEILIVVAKRTAPESLAVIEDIKRQHPERIRVHEQKLPFLGGAMREAFALATGDYVMLMSSDLETDPALIPAFADKMRQGGWDIVGGSRWIQGGGFEGYSRTKLLLNWVFQKIFRLLYFTKLTDLTYAYRLYRREVLRDVVWTELKHPFLLECLVKPLRCGARVAEIPCVWRARTEGASASTLLQTFSYLRIAFKARLVPLRRIKRSKSQ